MRAPQADAGLAAVDADLASLLYAWFNRGFLVLRRIDWNTPAAILEKIIRYEAVHQMEGWEDLRRRLDPADRRCFAFFHPALVDEPLVFVEVALMRDMPDAIAQVLDEPQPALAASQPRAAVFYSISNTQAGLKGITFGNFLLKQVVEELAREQPSLKTFATLSPMPQFAAWLAETAAGDAADGSRRRRRRRSRPGSARARTRTRRPTRASSRRPCWRSPAHYMLLAKDEDGKPLDPVARFHLRNGARLERINWMADPSPKGMRDAYGLMVNYRYDLKEIERNHEAYVNEGVVAASRAVRGLVKARGKAKAAAADAPAQAALPPPVPRQGHNLSELAAMEFLSWEALPVQYARERREAVRRRAPARRVTVREKVVGDALR